MLEYAERDPSRKDLRACASKLVSENVHVAKELVKGQFRVDVDSVNDLDCRLTAHRRTAHQRRMRAGRRQGRRNSGGRRGRGVR